MRIILLLFSLLLVFPLVQASEIKQYTAEYNLVLDKAIVDINLQFENFHSQIEWTLPRDASAIEVPEGLDFQVQKSEISQTITIKGKLFNQLHLKYITGSVIEKTQDRFFILDLGNVSADSLLVTVKLPEQATLKYSVDAPEPSFVPATDTIKTDGKRIILSWDNADLNKSKSILIIYNTVPAANFLAWGAILVIAILIVGLSGLFLYRHKPKKPRAASKKAAVAKNMDASGDSSSLTRNLFEDEKHIVEILLQAPGNELWQKELALKSGLSKVKLSRKLRSLEQKGLIEKIPYGNTNKVRVRKE